MSKETLKFLYQPVRRLDLTFLKSEMVDGGAAAGTYTSTKTLPAGCIVVGTKIKTTTGFTGDTTAVAIVGKGGATDDFFGASQSVLAAGDKYGEPATLAEGILSAATAPIVTITGGADFTNIVAGARMTVSIYYIDLNTKAV